MVAKRVVAKRSQVKRVPRTQPRACNPPMRVRRRAFLVANVAFMVEWRVLRQQIQGCTFPDLRSAAALATDSNGALVVWTGPIMTNNGGNGNVRLVHPSRIALTWKIEEEEIALR